MSVDQPRLLPLGSLVPDPNVGLVGVCVRPELVVPSLLVASDMVSPYASNSVAEHLLRNLNSDRSVGSVFGRGGIVTARTREPDDWTRPGLAPALPDMYFEVWCTGTYSNVPVWRRLSPSELLPLSDFKRAVCDGTMHVYLYRSPVWQYWSPLHSGPEFTPLESVISGTVVEH